MSNSNVRWESGSAWWPALSRFGAPGYLRHIALHISSSPSAANALSLNQRDDPRAPGATWAIRIGLSETTP